MFGIEISGEVQLGDLIVGVGTAALAIFTYKLARSTRESVNNSDAQLEAVRDHVAATTQLADAQDRPYIVPMPPYQKVGEIMRTGPPEPIFGPSPMGFRPYENRWVFAVRLWNIGSGAAIVESMSLDLDDHEPIPLLYKQQVIVDARIGASDQFIDADQIDVKPEAEARGVLSIVYRSPAAKRYVTRATVKFRGDYECDATDFRQSENDAGEA